MGQAFEFDGRIFESEGEFLDALAHEYKVGDREMVVDVLEQYGYDVSDINVRPGGEL